MEQLEPLETSALVVSRRKRVLHHVRVCASHLPVASERGTVQKTDTIHAKCAVAILTALANENPASGERLMLLAMATSPLSVHIYDYFIRADAATRQITESTLALVTRGVGHAERALSVASGSATGAKTRHQQSRTAARTQKIATIHSSFVDRAEKLRRANWSKKALKRFFRRRTKRVV